MMGKAREKKEKVVMSNSRTDIFILALRLELVSSLPDCRGVFAVIRLHGVMPGRRARAPTSDLYCCVSIVGHRTPPATHTCQ